MASSSSTQLLISDNEDTYILYSAKNELMMCPSSASSATILFVQGEHRPSNTQDQTENEILDCGSSTQGSTHHEIEPEPLSPESSTNSHEHLNTPLERPTYNFELTEDDRIRWEAKLEQALLSRNNALREAEVIAARKKQRISFLRRRRSSNLSSSTGRSQTSQHLRPEPDVNIEWLLTWIKKMFSGKSRET